MLVKWVALTLWQNQVCAQDLLSGPLKASLRLEPDSITSTSVDAELSARSFPGLTSDSLSVNFIVSHSAQKLLDAYMYVRVNLHFHWFDTTSQDVRYRLWTALKIVTC